MRIFSFLLMFSVIYFPFDARAGSPKYLFNLFWPGDHWTAQDFQPYQQNPRTQQNAQFRHDGWEPGRWVNGPGGAKAVLDGFFHSGILTGQDEDCDGVPLIEVGEPFLHLSTQEKSRIAEFIDYAYGITNVEGGMYYLTYRDDDNVIGVYSGSGLQLH